MKRRRLLQATGTVLVGAGTITATSGFTRVESQRRVTIDVDERVGEELYCEGRNEDFWIEGFSQGDGNEPTHEKGDTYLYVQAIRPGNHVVEETWVTMEAVDLTDWNEIEIIWENTGDNSTRNRSYLVVSENQMGNHDDYEVRLVNNEKFDTTEYLDVSGLNGEYYVRMHARNIEPGNNLSELYTYCVTLLP
ncbi:hypothetical protein [Natronosalvus vescus]|uniref:hypothetical protein n=1 Tax=Natronosalvus vescus TaxID=2953881 RepID=UPI002090EAEE|nr:hypothetical protein [Natronosalvus vescus]